MYKTEEVFARRDCARRPRVAVWLTALLMTAVWHQSVPAAVIDFETLVHGEVVTTQFAGSDGVTIGAVNFNRWHNLAIAFDSRRTGTSDPDLQGPMWSGGGNLAPDTVLGNMLIISENWRQSVRGIVNDPDDEGGRPAGKLIFDFEEQITAFGFDLVDIESTSAENGYVKFYNEGRRVGKVRFSDFVNPSSFFDSTVSYGNNSANRIAPITAEDLGVEGFDKVVIKMGGSGAVDNVNYVPEPGTLVLFLMGSLCALMRMRKTV